MQIFNHRVALATFEGMLCSAYVAQAGARRNRHMAALRAETVTGPRGTRPGHGTNHLAVGERMHRSWQCHKPNLYPFLGLDHWQHDEVCERVSATQLRVTDRVSWHGGRSVAQRSYQAVQWGAGLQRQVPGWQVSMQGISTVFRGRVEAEIRRRMPETDVKLGHIIDTAAPGLAA